MSDRNTIEHIGYIEAINEEMASIRINAVSACAACHAKGVCTSVDQDEKIMTISTGGMTFKIGEKVKVLIAKKTGLKAVGYGYFYPFLLILALIIILTILGFSELQAGLYALASLVPYYLIIYLFRNRINNTFTFHLQKLFNDI